jgi:hypothetical protein
MGARESASPPFTIEEIRSDSSETTLASARALLLEYGRFVVTQPGAARFCFGTLEMEPHAFPSPTSNKMADASSHTFKIRLPALLPGVRFLKRSLPRLGS